MKILPSKQGILVWESNSVATKNGNNDGTTAVAHKVNPIFAEAKLDDEKTTKNIVKSKNNIDNKLFFNFIKSLYI